MSRLRHFLGSCALAIFAAFGAIYGCALALAEWQYDEGWNSVFDSQRVIALHMNAARDLFPFEVRFRKGSALAQSIRANFEGNEPALSLNAINELYRALRTDYSSADLLAYATGFAVVLQRDDEARELLRRFRRVAGSSDLGAAIALKYTPATFDGKEQPQ